MLHASHPPFSGAFAGRRVLLTGHTGFKGGWAATWLSELGAEVTGLALPPEPGPSLFEAGGIGALLDSRIADISDRMALNRALADVDAEIVIHMAAQPLVRRSYREPVETIATNTLGTAHVLEAARAMPSLRAVIVVTSDKCYENNGWVWGYRESDALGGDDPYSASKGCTEIVAAAYGKSFFNRPGGPRLATVRAGNVFGGGDWGEDRLVPDIMRAQAAGAPITIRNPESVRPWQHVLEPIAGYLMVAARLAQGDERCAGAWNFGPDAESTVTVRKLTERLSAAWGEGAPEIVYGRAAADEALHEAQVLRLDSTKAKVGLGWRPELSLPEAIRLTVEWYQTFAAGGDCARLTRQQINNYTAALSQTAGGSPVPPAAPMTHRQTEETA